MTKDIVKEGYELAEKELKERQIQEVKKIVTCTLEKIHNLEKARVDLTEKIKIIKKDLDDLKLGKLDLIAERQEKDEKAKEVSVVVIIKEKEIIRETSPWYIPYRIEWPSPSFPLPQPVVWCGTGSIITSNTSNTTGNFCYINNSIAKQASVGTYLLEDESIEYLR